MHTAVKVKPLATYTLEEITILVSRLPPERTEIITYCIDCPGGRPGRLTVPPHTWWTFCIEDEWRYNPSDHEHIAERAIHGGALHLYYLHQRPDNTIHLIKRIVVENQTA